MKLQIHFGRTSDKTSFYVNKIAVETLSNTLTLRCMLAEDVEKTEGTQMIISSYFIRCV